MKNTITLIDRVIGTLFGKNSHKRAGDEAYSRSLRTSHAIRKVNRFLTGAALIVGLAMGNFVLAADDIDVKGGNGGQDSINSDEGYPGVVTIGSSPAGVVGQGGGKLTGGQGAQANGATTTDNGNGGSGGTATGGGGAGESYAPGTGDVDGGRGRTDGGGGGGGASFTGTSGGGNGKGSAGGGGAAFLTLSGGNYGNIDVMGGDGGRDFSGGGGSALIFSDNVVAGDINITGGGSSNTSSSVLAAGGGAALLGFVSGNLTTDSISISGGNARNQGGGGSAGLLMQGGNIYNSGNLVLRGGDYPNTTYFNSSTNGGNAILNTGSIVNDGIVTLTTGTSWGGVDMTVTGTASFPSLTAKKWRGALNLDIGTLVVDQDTTVNIDWNLGGVDGNTNGDLDINGYVSGTDNAVIRGLSFSGGNKLTISDTKAATDISIRGLQLNGDIAVAGTGNIFVSNVDFDATNSTFSFDLTGVSANSTAMLNTKDATFTETIGSGTINVQKVRGLGIGEYILADTETNGGATDSGTLQLNGGTLADPSRMSLLTEQSQLLLGITQVYDYDALSPYLRPNAMPLGGLITGWRGTALENGTLFQALENLSDAAAINAINQLPGDIFANGQLVAAELQSSFNGLLPTFQNGYGNYITPFSDSFRGQNRGVNYCNEYWGTPTGRWIERGDRGGYDGYELANFGVAFGVSRRLDSNRHVGLAFGYDYGKLEMSTLSQKDEINAIHFAAYGGYVDACEFFDWHVGYGKNFHETDRRVSFTDFLENPRAKYDDNVFSAGIMYGKRIGSFMPSVGVEFVQVWSPNFSESNGPEAALRGLKSDYTSLELPVGFRLSKTYCGGITPEFRAFWVPQLCDESSSLNTAFLAGRPDFVVDSGDLGWQHGRIGGGLKAHLSRNVDLTVNYDASIYSGHTRQTATGSIVVRF